MTVRKRRKKSSIGKATIILTSIIMLNFVGVSYAYWTDSLHINSRLTAGEIKPIFVGCTTSDIIITVNSKNTSSSFGNVSLLEGETKEISLTIKNNGTIPVKADKVEIDRNGLTIEIPAHEIEPQKQKIIEVALEADKAGEYDFNTNPIKIPYKQFNHQ